MSTHASVSYPIMFDTLAYTKKLKSAGVSEQQAEVQAEALATSLHEIIETNLATKQDIKDVRQEIKDVKQELKQEFKQEISRLDIKISDLKAELIKWVVGIAFLQASLTVSLIKLLP